MISRVMSIDADIPITQHQFTVEINNKNKGGVMQGNTSMELSSSRVQYHD